MHAVRNAMPGAVAMLGLGAGLGYILGYVGWGLVGLAPILIGLGVLTLSMAPVAIPFVREAISELDTASARQFALQALSIDSSEDIRNLLAQRYTKRTARLNSSPVPETAP